MAETEIEALIEGGKATAAPPLGPALGPLGVNIGQVVADINEKTKDFKNMQVPVTVKVDNDTKEYRIIVGTPPAAALILKEAGIQSGAGNPSEEDEYVADLSIPQVKKVSNMKQDSLTGKTVKKRMNEIMGTCRGMGVTVDGQRADKVIAKVNAGEYDEEIEAAE